MTVLAVDRSETLHQRRGTRFASVCHGDENEIPFVTLHVLQVLNK